MSADAAPDDLAAASPAAEAAPAFLMDGTRTTAASRRILPYDFRNPVAISEADLRVFEALYQQYVQDLSGRLSSSLRMECSLKTTKLGSLPISEFCKAIPNPSCITLFRVSEMRGVGLLDVSLPVALAMADRLLGGKGTAPSTERELTEIEMALTDDALLLILSAWATLWTPGADAPGPDIIGHESNALCLPMASTKEVFVIVDLEMTMGETTGLLHLGVPFSMVESKVREIQETQNRLSDTASPKQMQWRNQYAGISVPVFAEWKVRKLPLAETLRIGMGDIIELPASLINKASIHLSNLATFTGTVGIQNGNIAIQITGNSQKE